MTTTQQQASPDIDVPNAQAEFAGFPLPTKNFFSVPNDIIDIMADITNLSELKVVLYVLRHTWGFHEFGTPKAITNDEFMHGRKRREDGSRMDKGTGLSEQAVRNGVNDAVKHGYLICEVDDHDKARIKKSYKLKMLGVKTFDPNTLEVNNLDPKDPRPQESMPLDQETLTSGLRNVDLRPKNSRPRTEKETPERHFRNTRKKERSAQPSTPAHPDASLSLSPENSFSSSEGESPASVKGASSPPELEENDTLNLATQPLPSRSGNAGLPIAPRLGATIATPNVGPAVRVSNLQPPDNDAPPLNTSPQSVATNATGLLARLTEEQSTFWLRLCAISKQDPNKLSQRVYPHICALADRVTTTEDVQSLYDLSYAQLKALAEARGTEFLPPRPGNLVNALPDWEAKHGRKQRGRAQSGEAKFVPSYGGVRNSTYDRLERQKRGEVDEPLTYLRLPGQSRPRATQGNISHEDFALQMEQFKRIVGVRHTTQ